MIRVALLLLVGCAATAPRPPATPLGLVEATADLDGAAIGGSQGKATVLIVFASWCSNCHKELAVLDELRAKHPDLRVVGINYVGHEEYKGRGNPIALRLYLAKHAPWLRVVPADDRLFAALGQPSKIPTLFVYDKAGALVATFDRRERPKPTAEELAQALGSAGVSRGM